MPDFIIIGAPRCGTTSLYRHLSEHPWVVPASRKDIHFFDRKFKEGVDWYRSHFPSSLHRTCLRLLFGRNVITGEGSAYYLFHPLAARRAFDTVPEAKIIALLRNPIDRAYSHYHHELRKGRESLSFEQAVAAEGERLRGERERMIEDENYDSFNYRRYSYLARGIYADQLQVWMSLFPKEQIFVIRSEDFHADSAKIVKQTLQFLRLPSRELKEYRKYNLGQYTQMDPAIRGYLVEYFKPHNQRLRELLGRDFDWDG